MLYCVLYDIEMFTENQYVVNQIKSHSTQNVTPVASKLSQIYSNPF